MAKIQSVHSSINTIRRKGEKKTSKQELIAKIYHKNQYPSTNSQHPTKDNQGPSLKMQTFGHFLHHDCVIKRYYNYKAQQITKTNEIRRKRKIGVLVTHHQKCVGEV